MIYRSSVFFVATLSYLWLAILPCQLHAQERTEEPSRSTLVYRGTEREYFVRLPHHFDKKKLYWLLVVVHGLGGNGRTSFMVRGIRDSANDLYLDAIVVSLSLTNVASDTSQFPSLGEGGVLQKVIDKLRREYRLRPKILLMGYSRGGQFAHRFALLHPNQVEACASFASGTWTTPDGRLLIRSYGEVRDPESFLASEASMSAVPARHRYLFEPRFAEAAGLRAASGAKEVPFLVMCGSLDPRFDIAKEFARSLKKNGFVVQTEWPRTRHYCRHEDRECIDEFLSDFKRYPRATVDFFLRVTKGE